MCVLRYMWICMFVRVHTLWYMWVGREVHMLLEGKGQPWVFFNSGNFHHLRQVLSWPRLSSESLGQLALELPGTYLCQPPPYPH